MLNDLERNLIAAALSTAVEGVVKGKWGTSIQEHQLTSRIAGALEGLNGLEVFRQRVTVVAHEFPDKGPGALEKRTGVDLYVAITDAGPDGFSKGFFVQSKKGKGVHRAYELPVLDDGRLIGQCDKMISVSESSYVWSYGGEGIDVIDASSILSARGSARIRTRSTYELFRRIMECEEGDPRFGPRVTEDRRQALNEQMEKIDAHVGVSVRIAPAENLRVGKRKRTPL